VTEELRAAFEAAAERIPDPPDRLSGVLARRRRKARVRSGTVVAATVVLVAGVVLLVPSLRSASPARVAAAPGDCAHGGPPLSQEGSLRPLPAPSRGPDGRYRARSRVELELLPSCTTVRIGQEVTIRVRAFSDAASTLSRTELRLGGQSSFLGGSCAGYPLGEEPPEAVPAPGAYEETLRHTYTDAGTDDVRVVVGTVCSDFPGHAAASLLITVLVEGEEPPAH
jgi:hypothetical protein